MNKNTNLNVTSFFNSCNIPIAISNLNFTILEANEKVFELTGYSREELIGKNVNFITIDNNISFNIKHFKLLISKEIDSYTFGRYYKTKSGNKIYGSVTSSLFEVNNEKYILGIFNTELQKSENDFHTENYDTLNKILAFNPDVHYIVDNYNNSFVYQNTSILNYLGYDENDLEGANVIEFLKSKIRDEKLNYVENDSLSKNSTKLDGFLENEFKIKTKSDGWRWVKYRSVELVRQDEFNVHLRYVVAQDITKSKKIEEELNFHTEFLENITNLMPDLVFVYNCVTYEIIFTNIKDGNFLGYTESEWIGFEYPKARPDYVDVLNNSLDRIRVIQEGEVEILELPFISKNGDERWVLSKSKLFKRDIHTGETLILSVVSDIHDYKNAIENLKISKETNSSIINAIPDLILVVNKKGDYLYSFSGHDIKVDSLNDIIGKNVIDIIEQPIANKILNYIKLCIEQDQLFQFEFELTSNPINGNTFFSNYFSKLSDDSAIILVRDITKRKEAEKELGNKINLLSEQNKKMEQFISKNTELERFAYILSHDLKEPLRGVSTIAEILEKEIKSLNNTKLENLTKHLIDSAVRMNSMIDGVLEYSKTTNDFIEYKTINISEIVDFILKDLNLLINETGVKLIIKDLPNVKGSEIQIRQLLQNLINNAIKFNDNPNPYIEIGGYEDKTEVVFYVKDNGIGIKDQFKDSIFKMFRRLNSNKNYNGQGVGLSICKKIIERHNGRIWVENNQDEPTGSVFYFTLPLIN